MRRIGKLMLILAVSAVIISVPCGMATNSGQTKPKPKPSAEAEPGPPEKSLGSKSAPIVMEVFSDYSCPVCRNFYFSCIRPLLQDYVAGGKVLLIHRDFVLTGVPGHEHSRQAALLETAAARIGRFEEVDAALYEKQIDWVRDGHPETVVASVLSPHDMKRVMDLIAAGKVDSFVDSDKDMGNARRVSSTPTIYVTAHGRTELVPGNVSYSLLRRYLDEQLQH